ncbi:MAG TPA: GNAT family N-acetyltransferase [Thermoanaerobaculia bacterium]
MTPSSIDIAETDEAIAACFPVLRQLRPALDESTFVGDVRRMQQQGYVLASLSAPDVRAVAGYRYFEMFAFGPMLYVDDLVTDETHRSSGYGEQLLTWLKSEATRNGCKFLTLDSGLKRLGAHKFYRRHGMEEIALHFAISTDGGPMWTSE